MKRCAKQLLAMLCLDQNAVQNTLIMDRNRVRCQADCASGYDTETLRDSSFPASATRTPARAKCLVLPSSATVWMPKTSESTWLWRSVRPASADGGALRILQSLVFVGPVQHTAQVDRCCHDLLLSSMSSPR